MLADSITAFRNLQLICSRLWGGYSLPSRLPRGPNKNIEIQSFQHEFVHHSPCQLDTKNTAFHAQLPLPFSRSQGDLALGLHFHSLPLRGGYGVLLTSHHFNVDMRHGRDEAMACRS
jgi:hypothetical protein